MGPQAQRGVPLELCLGGYHQGKRLARGPQLPGSACLPRPLQRHDAFLLNDRDQPSRSPLPPIVPTGRVPSTRTGQRRTSGHPVTEGPSASTRPGRIDERLASSISSSQRPELGRRHEQRLIEQCHLQCFERPNHPPQALSPRSDRTMRPSSAPSLHRSLPARPERRRAGLDRQTFHIPATSSRSTGPARGNVIAFCQVSSLRPGQWRR